MGLQQGRTAKGAAAFSGSQEPRGHTEGLSSASSYQLFFYSYTSHFSCQQISNSCSPATDPCHCSYGDLPPFPKQPLPLSSELHV